MAPMYPVIMTFHGKPDEELQFERPISIGCPGEGPYGFPEKFNPFSSEIV